MKIKNYLENQRNNLVTFDSQISNYIVFKYLVTWLCLSRTANRISGSNSTSLGSASVKTKMKELGKPIAIPTLMADKDISGQSVPPPTLNSCSINLKKVALAVFVAGPNSKKKKKNQ